MPVSEDQNDWRGQWEWFFRGVSDVCDCGKTGVMQMTSVRGREVRRERVCPRCVWTFARLRMGNGYRVMLDRVEPRR
jgi:hypothetical protein